MKNQSPLWRFAVLALAAVAMIAIAHINSGLAQQAGGGGFGGAGGAGGGGGYGGGGGSIAAWSSGGSIAAHGEYVYVLERGRLSQYAAYDLTLVKSIKLKADHPNRRARGGGFGGGAGGRGGDAGQAGNGGQGGQGGYGGGFTMINGASSPSESVAAFGDFVYVLQGTTLQKLAADGLKSVQEVTLDRQTKTKD